MKTRVLITGVAGFIGYQLARYLLENGQDIWGIDNLNVYYDVNLKKNRLSNLGIFDNFKFIHGDISNKLTVNDVFEKYKPEIVVNLAAQAGVRYSIENPSSYIDSNIIGFFNIIEACRLYPVNHLVFASSSSVYGNQDKTPFSEDDNVDYPISLYAATKKSNELMGYTYSHLYHIPATGLRFFTVYGPYGRPDMAYFSFTQKIMSGEPIKIYNYGNLYRDFTYIDDIITGIISIMKAPPTICSSESPFKVYNIGNSKPERLTDFIEILEAKLGKKAIKEFLPMQPGDVYQTYADVSKLEHDFNFKPSTSLDEGLEKFVTWYKHYYL